jgi:hypothetical protein
LEIDGSAVASGALFPLAGPSALYIGDGTPTGGNVSAEIEYIRYINADTVTAAVPEPSSVVLLDTRLIGLLGVGDRAARAAALLQTLGR